MKELEFWPPPIAQPRPIFTASWERKTRACLSEWRREQHKKIALSVFVTSNSKCFVMQRLAVSPVESAVAISSSPIFCASCSLRLCGSRNPPDHFILRLVSIAIRSITSFIVATMAESPACESNTMGLDWFASSTLCTVCFKLSRFGPILLCNRARPLGFNTFISSSRFVAKWRAASNVKPPFAICTSTTGIPISNVSMSSSKHQGRVRTALVASSTSVSLLCTPSVIKLRRSLRVDESKNTGDFSILRRISCMYRASEAASIL
mmetsp:Transcript_48553/g.120367  ORF Transcript_48553/g.120367 Transcript_48553/m.120367 type:complete len:264 (+) Transcript_48553:1119-1910(+)